MRKDYILLSCDREYDFNNKMQDLLKKGYSLHGELIVYFAESDSGIIYSERFVQMFIKDSKS